MNLPLIPVIYLLFTFAGAAQNFSFISQTTDGSEAQIEQMSVLSAALLRRLPDSLRDF